MTARIYLIPGAARGHKTAPTGTRLFVQTPPATGGVDGWTRLQKMLRSDPMKGADGVVHRAESFRNASGDIHLGMTTPSAPLIGGGRQHLLMAQPPLLSQEGNSLPKEVCF
jgi:hypothetical protein